MRVLYVGSKPLDAVDLQLDREVTELQQRFADASAEPVEFAFLPGVRIEELPRELGRHRPDIVHIAAHGDGEALALTDASGREVLLTAEILRGFLPPLHPPRLVYLNSCNSDALAKELTASGDVAIAIGSSAPITNRAARAAAVAFYERLVAGLPVSVAFEVCRSMLKALSHGEATAEIRCRPGFSLQSEVFHSVPTLVADFDEDGPEPDEDDTFSFSLGVQGCPSSTTQVVFFTDDDDFIDEDDPNTSYEDELTLIARGRPANGVLWSSDDWAAAGDHRLFAVGVKAGGGTFVIESTLCKAIETRYLSSRLGAIPERVQAALAELRRNDGAEADPVVSLAKPQRKKRPKVTKPATAASPRRRRP